MLLRNVPSPLLLSTLVLGTLASLGCAGSAFTGTTNSRNRQENAATAVASGPTADAAGTPAQAPAPATTGTAAGTGVPVQPPATGGNDYGCALPPDYAGKINVVQTPYQTPYQTPAQGPMPVKGAASLTDAPPVGNEVPPAVVQAPPGYMPPVQSCSSGFSFSAFSSLMAKIKTSCSAWTGWQGHGMWCSKSGAVFSGFGVSHVGPCLPSGYVSAGGAGGYSNQPGGNAYPPANGGSYVPPTPVSFNHCPWFPTVQAKGGVQILVTVTGDANSGKYVQPYAGDGSVASLSKCNAEAKGAYTGKGSVTCTPMFFE